jgi:hypothetical protein
LVEVLVVLVALGVVVAMELVVLGLSPLLLYT